MLKRFACLSVQKLISRFQNEMEATTGVPENDSAPNNTSKSEEPFDYDAILEHVGQIGKFQLVTCITLCYPAIFTSTIVMSYAFTGFIPEYRYLHPLHFPKTARITTGCYQLLDKRLQPNPRQFQLEQSKLKQLLSLQRNCSGPRISL